LFPEQITENYGNLISHIQNKIQMLKNEIKAIQYTMNIDSIGADSDISRINECTQKIQVLNEILISYKPQPKK
jgi:thiamine biosynthesis lipoprotein ApbE